MTITTAPSSVSVDVTAYEAHLGLIGDVDDTAFTYAINTYVDATSGDKARMRAVRNETTKARMSTVDPSDPSGLVAVKALMALEDAQSAAVGTKAKVDVDPRITVAVSVAALLRKASDLVIESGPFEDQTYVSTLVDLAIGLDVDTFGMSDLVNATLDNRAPEDVTAYAAKIKLPTGRGDIAEGGDVAAHIYQALVILDRPAKISEIVKVATEAYPNGASGSGAISARLFPTKGDCTVAGVVPTYVDGVKGAKLA